MEKYYIGDDASKNDAVEGKPEKITLEILKEKVKNMCIYAEVEVKSERRASVVVHKNTGTTMYLSSEFSDHYWLQANAIKKEDHDGIIRYHFVLD